MLDRYAGADLDIIFFDSIRLDSDTCMVVPKLSPNSRLIALSKIDYEKGEAKLRYLFGQPWCKMVRKSVIDEYQIRFETTRVREEGAFSYLVGFYAKKAEIYESAAYVYSVRKSSLSSSVSFSEDQLIRVGVYRREEKFLKEHCVDYSPQNHYDAVVKLLLRREFLAAKQAVTIIKSYNPSSMMIYRKVFSLLLCVALRLPSRCVRRVARMLFRLAGAQ